MLKIKIVAEVEMYAEQKNLEEVKNNAIIILVNKLKNIEPTVKADPSKGGLVKILLKENK